MGASVNVIIPAPNSFPVIINDNMKVTTIVHATMNAFSQYVILFSFLNKDIKNDAIINGRTI